MTKIRTSPLEVRKWVVASARHHCKCGSRPSPLYIIIVCVEEGCRPTLSWRAEVKVWTVVFSCRHDGQLTNDAPSASRVMSTADISCVSLPCFCNPDGRCDDSLIADTITIILDDLQPLAWSTFAKNWLVDNAGSKTTAVSAGCHWNPKGATEDQIIQNLYRRQ